MKILMVTDSMARGGKERRMLELIKGLTLESGYTIRLLSLTDNLEYEYVYQLPIEFEIIKRKHRRDLSVFAKLDKVVRTFKPDIVHSWGSMASVYLVPVIWWRRLRFLNGIIADAPGRLKWYNGSYLRKMITYPFSDRIISNSKAGIDSYRVPGDKAVCVYNGVDMKRFAGLPDINDMRRELIPGYKEGNFIVGMVAAFEKRKDYRTLVEAAASLLPGDADLRFILVGDGVDLTDIKKAVPVLFQDKILFTGKRADVESIIQVMNIGVLLTNSKVHGEGISNSIIEYMALGKPVLATRGGGTDEIVQDGKNGYLLDPESSAQLVQRIRELKNNRSLCEQFGEAGRKLVREQFNLESMTAKYKEIYHRIINERRNA